MYSIVEFIVIEDPCWKGIPSLNTGRIQRKDPFLPLLRELKRKKIELKLWPGEKLNAVTSVLWPKTFNVDSFMSIHETFDVHRVLYQNSERYMGLFARNDVVRAIAPG